MRDDEIKIGAQLAIAGHIVTIVDFDETTVTITSKSLGLELDINRQSFLKGTEDARKRLH